MRQILHTLAGCSIQFRNGRWRRGHHMGDDLPRPDHRFIPVPDRFHTCLSQVVICHHGHPDHPIIHHMMTPRLDSKAWNSLFDEGAQLVLALVDHRCVTLEADNADDGILAETIQHTGNVLGIPHGIQEIDQGDALLSTVGVLRGWHKQSLPLGLEHGVYCLGCCWLLFVILFPLGMLSAC